MIIANNSEYIRTSHPSTQNVTTPIKFLNTIELLGDTSSENALISKKQATELIDQKVQDLVENNKIEKLTKLTFNLSGRVKRQANGNIVACHNNTGGCNLLFMDTRGYPLEILGYSLGEKYNNVTQYNTIAANVMGNKQVYFALLKDKNYVAYNYNTLRRCSYPLSDSDKNYFADREIICININYENNELFTSNYDWLNPCSIFKGHSFNIPGSNNKNAGMLFSLTTVNNTNGNVKFWIEDDDFDSLHRFMGNVCGVVIGPCINVASELY